MKITEHFTNFEISKDKNKWHLADYANLQVKNILELNKLELKKLVLEELDKDQPSLKFLLSEEVIDVYWEIFEELLEEDKKDFEEKLKIKDEEITFDLFVEKSKLDIFWDIYNNVEYIGSSQIKIDLKEKKKKNIDKFYNTQTKYSKRYFDMLEYCLKKSNLDEQQSKIIKDKIGVFKNNWIHLCEDEKNELEKINEEIVDLWSKIKKNAKIEKSKVFTFKDETFLKNIDKKVLENAKNKASEKKLEWYAFDFNKNTIETILEWCSDSGLRKKYYEQAYSLAISWKNNNNKISIELIKLKNKKAKILWYDSPQDLLSFGKIMENTEEVRIFLDDFLKWVKIKYKDEIDEIKKEFKLKEVFAWDVPYYLNELKKTKYSFDKKDLKDYLEFETVKESMFEKAEELYWIEIKKVENSDLQYRNDVEVYGVYKNNRLISYFLWDYYSKKNKSNSGVASVFSSKKILKNWDVTIPVVANIMSIDKSQSWETFLSLQEWRTLFHEFWHALSEILVESKYSELGWFNIEWDALELASRYFEEFILNPDKIWEVLKNYKTNENLPKELIEKYRKSELLWFWNNKMRQLMLAYLDLSMHSWKEFKNVEEFEQNFQNIVNKISFLDRWKYHEEWVFLHPVLWYWSKYYVYLLWEVLGSYAHKHWTTKWFLGFLKEWIKKWFWENYNDNTKWKFSSKPYFEEKWIDY